MNAIEYLFKYNFENSNIIKPNGHIRTNPITNPNPLAPIHPHKHPLHPLPIKTSPHQHHSIPKLNPLIPLTNNPNLKNPLRLQTKPHND